MLPRIVARRTLAVEDLAGVLDTVVGHWMAKAALEMAWLDAQLRAEDQSLAAYLGADKDAVDCGVSVGIMASIPELLEAVDRYLADGYPRAKLHTQPRSATPPRAAAPGPGSPPLPLPGGADTP